MLWYRSSWSSLALLSFTFVSRIICSFPAKSISISVRPSSLYFTSETIDELIYTFSVMTVRTWHNFKKSDNISLSLLNIKAKIFANDTSSSPTKSKGDRTDLACPLSLNNISIPCMKSSNVDI